MTTQRNRPAAVIMGLGHPRQTAFARSLARFGVPVHAMYGERNEYVHSRRLTQFHELDDDPQLQLSQLEALGRKLGRAFLVPSNDDYVALVSRNLDRLSRLFVIPLPDWNVIESILDRDKCYAKAASIGIRVPRYWVPDSDAAMQQIVAALQPEVSDYIIKTPTILSAPANEAAARLSKAAPKRREDILASCAELKDRTGNYPMIQEVVPGQADSAIGVTMVVSPEGKVILAYCVRRLRLASYKIDAGYVHPYELGSVVWCETIHDEEAMAAARELVRAFDYTGQITIEFRRDSRDGSLYLMKVEPRPVRATSLSTAIGMDIPTILYRTYLGEAVDVPRDYPDGVGWLWTMAYGSSLFYNPHHNRRDALRVLRSWHRIKAFGEDYADPMPLIRWALGWTARAVFARRRSPAPSVAAKPAS